MLTMYTPCHYLDMFIYKPSSVCKVFVQEYYVNFNSLKIHMTVYSKDDNIVGKDKYTVNGEILNICNSIQHLVHTASDSVATLKAFKKG